jgi:broad specificity phosphatase PhoE
MKKTLLIRHGQSTANIGEASEHPGAAMLSEEGHMQARELAENFNEKPDLIVVSSFIRTMMTAMPLIQKFPYVPVEVWDSVHEFVPWSHEFYKGANQVQKDAFKEEYFGRNDLDYVHGEGAESFNQLVARADEMLAKIDKSKFTVIFTHHDFIQVVLMRLNNLPMTFETFLNMDGIKNTEIVEILG